MTAPARRLTLASGAGHDWSCDPADTDPKSRTTLWRCSRCGFEDVIVLADFHDPGMYLDQWASLGTRRPDGGRRPRVMTPAVTTLPSRAGHSWVRMDEPELELSGQVAWKCERCGYEDCLSLDGYHQDPGATLDRWAALGTGLTCDDLMVQEVLGS